MTVILTVFDRDSFRIGEELEGDLRSYIDDNYAGTFAEPMCCQSARVSKDKRLFGRRSEKNSSAPVMGTVAAVPLAEAEDAALPRDLDDALRDLDESFSETLLRMIDERGMTDAQCYKKANIDRKLFSKIRGDVHYKPSKPTVFAFAIALELSYEETKTLLSRAGFAFSHANKFDVIVEYFIRRGECDIFTVNEALFAYDQPLLGA